MARPHRLDNLRERVAVPGIRRSHHGRSGLVSRLPATLTQCHENTRASSASAFPRGFNGTRGASSDGLYLPGRPARRGLAGAPTRINIFDPVGKDVSQDEKAACLQFGEFDAESDGRLLWRHDRAPISSAVFGGRPVRSGHPPIVSRSFRIGKKSSLRHNGVLYDLDLFPQGGRDGPSPEPDILRVERTRPGPIKLDVDEPDVFMVRPGRGTPADHRRQRRRRQRLPGRSNR